MKLKTKKIIAKEILYFFICIAVSLLFFGGTFGYNWFRKAQVINIEKDIVQEEIIVDSLLSKNIAFSKVLQDYVSEWNSGRYKTQEELNTIFPKIKLFDGRYNQALADYVASWNSGKYKTQEELNSKFPEFFPISNQIDSTNKKRTFKVNSDIYDIPFEEADLFLKEYPNAVEMKSFLLQKDTFNIEFNEINNFISENPDAMPIYEFSRNDSINIHKCYILTLKTKMHSYEHKVLLFDEQIFNSVIVLFVFLVILYPVRLIVLLIFWSVRILKQK